ncbi:hypothetical protein ACFQS2_00785 [Brachybacterium sp. GCM10030267]|uniref:hypothetical protein n=1 Tax=Brachybacterium sp. GCM10030267 TaxID=3273381 RepID=UPI003613A616
MNDPRDGQDEGINVLILADPGLCARRAEAARELFEEELTQVYGNATVTVQTQFLGISDHNTIDMGSVDAVREDFEPIDVALMLTEMPRRSEGRPLIAELHPEKSAATLSYPTIGLFAPRQRLVNAFMACVLRLTAGGTEEDRDRVAASWNQWSEPSEGPPRLRSRAVTGAVRTVTGMVATNAPWRAFPKLSSALAAASGAGAFGIFYNSIWTMSAALSPVRLLLIGLLAIILMTGWLIFRNSLWERPSTKDRTMVLLYYNLSTVLTIFLCVLGLYLSLVVLILCASLVIISPDFMATILQEPAKFARYVDIAWLSAAMGVVAGGLGSGFDDETDLEQLTHSRREQLRRLSREDEEH